MKRVTNSSNGRVSGVLNFIFKKLCGKNTKNDCAKIDKKSQKNKQVNLKSNSSQIKSEKLSKYLPHDKTQINQNVKNEFEKFPIETLEAFESCGYEITELLTKKSQDNKLLERIAIITKEFNYGELKSISGNDEKIYGIGEFITGGHEQTGISSTKYLELLRKMIA